MICKMFINVLKSTTQIERIKDKVLMAFDDTTVINGEKI